LKLGDKSVVHVVRGSDLIVVLAKVSPPSPYNLYFLYPPSHPYLPSSLPSSLPPSYLLSNSEKVFDTNRAIWEKEFPEWVGDVFFSLCDYDGVQELFPQAQVY
jgi:hypothetical protein